MGNHGETTSWSPKRCAKFTIFFVIHRNLFIYKYLDFFNSFFFVNNEEIEIYIEESKIELTSAAIKLTVDGQEILPVLNEYKVIYLFYF